MSHFPPLYLTISRTVNAPARLAALRARVANGKALDWRAARDWRFDNGADAFGDMSQGFKTENAGSIDENRVPVWYTHTGPKFRNEQFCDEVEDSGIDHRGWFTDDSQGSKIRGIVGMLSHGRFVIGYYDSGNGERVYFDEVYTNAADAAVSADSEAERVAEEEREYNERRCAAREKADEADNEEKEIARLFALRNHSTLGEDARADIGEHIAELRALRSSLKNEYSDIEM